MFFKKENKSSHPLDEQVQAGLRGDFERGWQIAQTLMQESPACNRAAFNRAWYLMMQGDLLGGLECLDRGRWERVFGDGPLPTNKPIWRDQNLQGKFILLCSEGGLGDEIINARFASDFAKRGAKVTMTCDPSLVSVFSRIEGISCVIGHKHAPNIYHDFWVPGMSAAHVLQYNYQKLTGEPYLTVHPDYKNKWAQILREKYGAIVPKIGLRFYGNPKFEHEQHRRFPQQDLISAVGDRDWINLQKEESSLPLETWEDTLALISHLDLVITSCTSVAHASAALGKETWVITPVLPYYIWALPGSTSPWYKSVRLFRQKKFGQWDNVFQEINQALQERSK